MEPEEPSLPAVRRSNSMDLSLPSTDELQYEEEDDHLDTQQVKHDGAVLIYQDLGSSIDTYTFRIYLSNASTHLKELKKGRFSAVDKNTFCLLVEGNYHLMSEPSGEIDPEYLPFKPKSAGIRGFFEAHYEHPPPFKFNLKVSGSDVTAWTATIRQDDLKTPSILQRLRGQFQWSSSRRRTFRQQRTDASDEGITSKKHSLLHQPGASAEPRISQTTGRKAEFVEKNRLSLIQRVTEVLCLADYLLDKRVFTKATYDCIREAKTSQEQMRILFDAVHPKGKRATSAFYDALKQYESFLVEDLEEDQGR